ncbi:NADPH-dependent F420 reductase [Bdellovibrio svalbardensis]|uniref:NAD(P)-binding domain-containing protein n=1 Tax=Bdellovibrio svalbardensis TaxID=2972972 RepID=A0ABT6DJ67_9BACT|nr:NAD(P)-binding domain-containing protein [Bdellovibrio svalbardensis]MDG0815959.1 NAD(P)-binding domain-containing protein [Bdellovibrio svalbardensis]
MTMRKIAVLGSGPVGERLANGFLKNGYQVMRGSREPSKLKEWKEKSPPGASIGTFEEAARFGDMIVLSVKGSAAESVVKGLPSDAMKGKTVIDTTNPIADLPPVNGVLNFFTGPNESLMERLQKAAPAANFVKSFSCVGNEFMVEPHFSGGAPTMFICGNDKGAKAMVLEILTQFGWETEDMGSVEGARAIEPLCMLWCIPGFLRNQWGHAFKLLKKERA